MLSMPIGYVFDVLEVCVCVCVCMYVCVVCAISMCRGCVFFVQWVWVCLFVCVCVCVCACVRALQFFPFFFGLSLSAFALLV